MITQSLNEYREVLFRTQQQMAAFVAVSCSSLRFPIKQG